MYVQKLLEFTDCFGVCVQPTQGLGDLSQQNMLLQQPALQAALAAQCMAAQTQLLPQQTMQLLSRPSGDQTVKEGQVTAPSEGIQPRGDSPPVTSQELSVAQMMMTLARASNKNMLAQNGSNSQAQPHAPK